jgi:hypothetical protein
MEIGGRKFARQAAGMFVQFLVMIITYFTFLLIILVPLNVSTGKTYSLGIWPTFVILALAWWLSSYVKKKFYRWRGWKELINDKA